MKTSVPDNILKVIFALSKTALKISIYEHEVFWGNTNAPFRHPLQSTQDIALGESPKLIVRFICCSIDLIKCSLKHMVISGCVIMTST